jgi:N-acetylglucosamine-6-phosphate deacetylase
LIELRGRVLVDGVLRPGRVLVMGERIDAVELFPRGRGTDAESVIAPGFVDLHVHGFGGADPLVDLAGMARALARAGTTAFQPTLFPREPRSLGEDCKRLDRARAALVPGDGAHVLGFHLEGPFVNPAAAGALPPADLARPTREGLRAILGSATGSGRGVRTMTLAPELAGASELVSELVRSGVRVSLGHTRASAAEARAAVRAGAVGATHLFNAMSPLHHREAGMVGVALASPTLYAEIIGDLVHVGGDAFEVALAARGPEGLCLVSDALEGAGTGCEVFHTHGRELHVRDGASWYRPEGSGGEERLAGSASSQLEMVRKLVARGIVGLADALVMASTTPARALGVEHEAGRIVAGARADLLVLEGQGLALTRVLVGGRDVG